MLRLRKCWLAPQNAYTIKLCYSMHSKSDELAKGSSNPQPALSTKAEAAATQPKINTDSKFHAYLSNVLAYLEEVTHMGDLRKSQAHVLDIKHELRHACDSKREIMRSLDDVRQRQHHIYSEMKILNSRSSDRYLHLVRQELELCTLEQEMQEKYSKADSREFYLFNEFSTAITESYEKEKMHSNFLKVLGIFGTLLGALITLFASIASHIYQQNKLSNMYRDMHGSITEHVVGELQTLNKRLTKLDERVSSDSSTKNNTKSNDPSKSWGAYLHRNTKWLYSWAIYSK